MAHSPRQKRHGRRIDTRQQPSESEVSRPWVKTPSWIPAIASWFAVAVAVFILTYRPITDPDTWFHLELGEWIAANNSLPRTDPFSYTAGNTPYVPSGWATAWLMFQLDKIYPESSLGYILMVTVVIGLACVVVMWRGRKCGTTTTTGLLLLAGLTAAVIRFSPRPDIFSMLGLTTALALMSSSWISTSSESHKLRLQRPQLWKLLLLVPLVIVWANLHAGVLIAIPFLAVYAGWLILRWRKSRDQTWLLSAAPVLLACFAWMLNPYGWGIVGLARRIARMPDVTWVIEWMPFFKENFPLSTPVYVGTAVILAGLLWVLMRNRRAFHPIEIIWILMLLALVLLQRRQISLFAFGLPLLLSRHIGPAEKWLRGRTNLIATFAPLAAAGLVAWVQISGANGNGGGLPTYGRSVTVAPVFTADYLAASSPPQPMFNSYNFGGYLLHKLYPNAKVYIDGRLDVYPEQVWLDMLAVEENRLTVEEIVARYGIQTFVIGIGDSFGDPMHLATRLANNPDYVLAHFDDVAAVFVQKSLENLAWIERYGYRTVSPWNLDRLRAAVQQPGQVDSVIRETGRLLEQAPASAATHATAAYIAWIAGDPVTMDEQMGTARSINPNHPLIREVQRRMAVGRSGGR